jgi:hypothetical protein
VHEQFSSAADAGGSGDVAPSAVPAAEYVSYLLVNSVQQQEQQQQQQQQQGDLVEQLQLLSVPQESINSLQQQQQQQQGQKGVCLSQWCSSVQPLLHLLPLDALAGIAIQLGQQQQQQQCVQVPFVTDTAFLQTFSAAAAAAAAAAASNAAPNPPQQQQQVLQQLLDILLWSTSQLSQQRQQQWQQQQWQQWQQASLDPTQQHQQQLQQQQCVRGNLITLLQTSVTHQRLLQGNCQQLKQLLLVWGRLGVIPDEAWMGQWLAAARHCMSDMVIPFQQQQQAAAAAAAAYADLVGLLSALAAAKVKPAEAWTAAWQAAAMAAMAAAPNFSSSSSSASPYLLLLHQLLHAVSFLQLQLLPEFWVAHEGLLQQQLLQFNAGQLLLLLQAHQQCGLRPSGVAVKYMAAQLQQRIQHCWQQQQQQQQGAARGSSSSSEVFQVCCVLCGLSAWGVRVPMSSAAQLLVCLAAEKQALPLAWLLQVSTGCNTLVYACIYSSYMCCDWMPSSC